MEKACACPCPSFDNGSVARGCGGVYSLYVFHDVHVLLIYHVLVDRLLDGVRTFEAGVLLEVDLRHFHSVHQIGAALAEAPFPATGFLGRGVEFQVQHQEGL